MTATPAPSPGFGIVGCGLIGRKRLACLPPGGVRAVCDLDLDRARSLASTGDIFATDDFDRLLAHPGVDAVIVATLNASLAPLAARAAAAGKHVLVEKPAARTAAELDVLAAAAHAHGVLVRVGYNHRYHPALLKAREIVDSGGLGPLMFIRARYGHGGRVGYDREWRADPAQSGGGELIDQGMHLLDLVHWLAGPLPLHSALLRTQFWDTDVDDNAALLLGVPDDRAAPWAMLHVTWTEWKNMFSIEAYCRTAKLVVEGLVRSYGPQTLRIYRMSPELGPPALEERTYGTEDASWSAEWAHFVAALGGREPLLGGLGDAHYAWSRVQDAYAGSAPYAAMRQAVS